MWCFFSQPFLEQIRNHSREEQRGLGVASVIAVQMRLHVPKKITTGLLHCQPRLVLMPLVPILFGRNLSSDCMKNVLARQSSWLLIWNEDQKASSNHLLSTTATPRTWVTRPHRVATLQGIAPTQLDHTKPPSGLLKADLWDSHLRAGAAEGKPLSTLRWKSVLTVRGSSQKKEWGSYWQLRTAKLYTRIHLAANG